MNGIFLVSYRVKGIKNFEEEEENEFARFESLRVKMEDPVTLNDV